MSMNT